MFRFRASSLGLIMTDPVSIDPDLFIGDLLTISRKTKKTDEDKAILAPLWDQSLSAGAKTEVERLAKQFVYGFDELVTSKYMEKGIAVEDRSIELYNSVFFTDHKKNTERRSNEWITGECDILAPNKIIDVKSSWSLATFPATSKAAHDKGYEWQGRAYMMLWEVDEFEVAHCLVSTPEELIGWEDPMLHNVDHITESLRVTRCHYKRDRALEAKIQLRVSAANNYMDAMVKQIADEHNF